jgi:hypothetical protein
VVARRTAILVEAPRMGTLVAVPRTPPVTSAVDTRMSRAAGILTLVAVGIRTPVVADILVVHRPVTRAVAAVTRIRAVTTSPRAIARS